MAILQEAHMSSAVIATGSMLAFWQEFENATAVASAILATNPADSALDNFLIMDAPDGCT
jgi:hypothetical protein